MQINTRKAIRNRQYHSSMPFTKSSMAVPVHLKTVGGSLWDCALLQQSEGTACDTHCDRQSTVRAERKKRNVVHEEG